MKKYSGFTLLEILLYVVIGGITLVIAVFSFTQLNRLSTSFRVNNELNQTANSIISQIQNIVNKADTIISPKMGTIADDEIILRKDNLETTIKQESNNITVSYSNGDPSYNLNTTGILINTLSFEQINAQNNTNNTSISQSIKLKFTLRYNKPALSSYEYEAEKPFETTISLSNQNQAFEPILNTYSYRPLATGGDTTTDITVGNDRYRVHTFTTVGQQNLNVIQGGEFEYLVVGGGGAGGRHHGGGGGAGGFLTGETTVTQNSYTINVGGGGAPTPGTNDSPSGTGGKGENSSAFGFIAIGGGGGGNYSSNGGSGGSGGGGNNWLGNGGAASPPGQGFNGSNNRFANNTGGGGGGAGGSPVSNNNFNNGGIGKQSDITGTMTYYAGGGAAGTYPGYGYYTGSNTGGNGGGGNGGIGPHESGTNGQNGTANTGGGGGGTADRAGLGGNGGSGIVIVRYKLGAISPAGDGPLATGGNTTTDITVGNVKYRVHTFTTVGPSSLNVLQGGAFEYLVVGGGGGGQAMTGGGAGGYRSSVAGESSGGGGLAELPLILTPNNYTVMVGDGGAAGNPASFTEFGKNGGNSSFAGIISLGGGGGSVQYNGSGLSGGSGGGGHNAGGSGTSAQGLAGGTGTPGSGGCAGNGGGGGGAATTGSGRNGGNGIISSINGTLVTRAGGGAGEYNLDCGGAVGTAGTGGGGGSRVAGQVNTGGGGGSRAAGGSGIVIVRYKLGVPKSSNGAAYGLRRLSGFKTNPNQLYSISLNYNERAIRVRRDRGLDQAEIDIGFNSKGELDQVALQNFVGYQNFLNYSEDITTTGGWSLNNITSIPDNTLAPDGTNTAEKINLSIGNNNKSIAKNINIVSGSTYTESYYVKANNNYNFVQIAPSTGFPIGAYQNYNLSNGTLAGSSGISAGQANIQSVGNGWYRISLTSTANSTVSGGMLLSIVSSASSGRLETINVETNTDSIFVWGAMRHLGSTLKPYQKTDINANTGDGYITTWYDQSGDQNNAIQATTGAQPKIVDGVNGVIKLNNKPVIQFDGNDQLVNQTFNNTTNSTAFFVASRAANNQSFMARSTNFATLSSTDLFNIYYLNKSSTAATVGADTKNSLNLYTAIRTSAINSTLAIGAGSIGNFLNGNMAELIIYDGNRLSNKTAIENNLRDYYGTP